MHDPDPRYTLDKEFTLQSQRKIACEEHFLKRHKQRREALKRIGVYFSFSSNSTQRAYNPSMRFCATSNSRDTACNRTPSLMIAGSSSASCFAWSSASDSATRCSIVSNSRFSL